MTHPTQSEAESLIAALEHNTAIVGAELIVSELRRLSAIEQRHAKMLANLRAELLESQQLACVLQGMNDESLESIKALTELAQSRLEQMQADRKQALEWRDRVAQLEAERVPMTPEQIKVLAQEEELLLICDGLDSLEDIVREVEAHHGITQAGEVKHG